MRFLLLCGFAGALALWPWESQDQVRAKSLRLTAENQARLKADVQRLEARLGELGTTCSTQEPTCQVCPVSHSSIIAELDEIDGVNEMQDQELELHHKKIAYLEEVILDMEGRIATEKRERIAADHVEKQERVAADKKEEEERIAADEKAIANGRWLGWVAVAIFLCVIPLFAVLFKWRHSADAVEKAHAASKEAARKLMLGEDAVAVDLSSCVGCKALYPELVTDPAHGLARAERLRRRLLYDHLSLASPENFSIGKRQPGSNLPNKETINRISQALGGSSQAQRPTALAELKRVCRNAGAS